MSARSIIDYPRTAYGPAVQPDHVGLGPTFIEEDQSMRIYVGKTLRPSLALSLYCGAFLFAGMQRLFSRLQPNFSNAR